MPDELELAKEGQATFHMSRRQVLSTAAAAAVAGYVGGVRPALAQQNPKFVACLGWTSFDSGAALLAGYEDAVSELGGELTVSDAGFDPKTQSEQIDSAIASSPDAIFITPADAAAIAPAVQRAIDAGIPTFCGDSMVPGVAVHSTALSSNYGMGFHTAEWMAKKLEGNGKVAIVTLPQNESWDQRTLGMEHALRKYPGLEVAARWAFNFTADTTPRQAVENMLAAHDDIDAVWCAWDGAAIEGALAVQAAGRDNIFLTGIDGGEQSFSYIAGGTPFQMTCAQSFYEMAFLNALYAHEHLAGNNIPRLVITPTYQATYDDLKDVGPDAADYDRPGRADELGWVRVL